MPNVISVRQTEVLPSASFRFHLAMDTLAVRLTVPTAKSVADLHRQVIVHAGRTYAALKRALLLYTIFLHVSFSLFPYV